MLEMIVTPAAAPEPFNTPLAAEKHRVLPSDGTSGDWFGSKIVISQDASVIAVASRYSDEGTFTNTGHVQIFRKTAGGYVREAKIPPPILAGNNHFGLSLDISADGNTIIAGSYVTANPNVCVIEKQTNWVITATLRPADFAAIKAIGRSVAISGDGNTILLSGEGDAAGGQYSGTVYYYKRSGTSWIESGKIYPNVKIVNDYFGKAVSINYDGTIAAIASMGRSQPNLTSGTLFVFNLLGGVWQEKAMLVPSNPQNGSEFGFTMKISPNGNDIVAGAAFLDAVTGTQTSHGGAYVFTNSDGSWYQQAFLLPGDNFSDDRFGTSVSISENGDTVAIGASYAENTTFSFTGNVYVFKRTNGVWVEKSLLVTTESYTQGGGQLGTSTSISYKGDIVVSGAPVVKDGGGISTGGFFVFY